MMKLIRKSDPTPTTAAAIRPGVVCEVGDDGLCRISTGDGHDRAFHWAAVALAENYAPVVGDRVLVAGEDSEGCYVIGVLKRTA